jgi:signal transduction histidine kinase
MRSTIPNDLDACVGLTAHCIGANRLTASPMSTDTPTETHTRLRSPWLIVARLAWVTLTLLILSIVAISIPPFFDWLFRALAVLEKDFAQVGLPRELVTIYLTALNIAPLLVFITVALLIFWRKSSDWMALFVSFTLVLTWPPVAPSLLYLLASQPGWLWPINFLRIAGRACAVIFLYLFPNGRFVPHWTKWLAPIIVADMSFGIVLASPLVIDPSAVPLVLDSSAVPLVIDPSAVPFVVIVALLLAFVVAVVCLGLGIFAQIYRYRRVSGPVERQQTKWAVYGLTIAALGGLTTLVVILPLVALTQPDLAGLFFYGVACLSAGTFFVVLSPLAIGFSILRYRLWDIDLVINRTLVYGVLTASVVGGYALIFGTLGALFQAHGSFLISLLATGLIAVLFQPLRLRVQRAVNHLLYGERDEPYTVLSRLGQRLEATLAPDAVLPTIVQTIAEALKLPYVAIALATVDRQLTTDDRPPTGDVAIVDLPISQIPNADDGFGVVAAYGTPTGELLRLPLVYQHEIVGQLRLAPRARGEVFTPADRRLLEDLARQAGVAASAVRLTLDLQRARAQLILAREEERRRLRRDLHDGLGPALASQTLKVGSARALLTRDPATADALLAGLETDIATAIADIRRLVYNLRPPALDELGLLGAIRQHVAQYRGNGASGLQIVVEAPEALLPLPAAVEVAAYRIVQEALTNVVRHAQARTCRICLTLNGALSLEIRDDGVGLPAIRQAGVGLVAMRERAAELGGMCVVKPASGGGTCIRARLPFAECDT